MNDIKPASPETGVTPIEQYRLPIRRPVTTAMLFITLLVFGWRSYEELPLNLMPDISYPTLTVRTEYAGAAPEDVEELVTRPVEERLSVVKGVVEVSSISSAELSEVILEFRWDTDMDQALLDVRESLDMFDPPQGVTQNPIILRYDPTLDPVVRVAIRGRNVDSLKVPAAEQAQMIEQDLTEIREATERQLKSDLEAEPGIAQVVVKGGREEEIQILLDSERLKNLMLTPQSIVQALEQQNINLSGGRLQEGKTEYLVRTLNEFQNVDEIREVLVRTPDGQAFRLADIAAVHMGEKEREAIVRVNGQEAVELEIFKEGDANTVQVAEKLKAFFGLTEKVSFYERWVALMSRVLPEDQVANLQKELESRKKAAAQLSNRLPDYAEPILITDQSRFIESSIREVQQTAIVGGLLALAVLFLFLREWRSTIIIGVAIPISVVASFVPMYMRDVTLNIMSLGGLALGIGMLVDNSIVVLESVFRCREEGDGLLEAAERGTKEVAGAVTASTLTTIAVFAPIVFVEGIAGQLFRDLALTVTFSLLASLLVALYLIPMIVSRRGIMLAGEQPNFWIIRAYQVARNEGHGRAAALARIPKSAVPFAREWTRQTWNDTAGRVWVVVRGGKDDDGQPKHAWFTRFGAILLLPVVLALFALQVIIRLGASIVLTAFFLAAVFTIGVLWVLFLALRVILYVPVDIFDRLFRATRAMYALVLRQSLSFTPLILAGVLALAVHASFRAQELGRELIPPMKQGEFSIRMEAQPGTRIEDTEQRARELEQIVRAYPHVETVTVEVGSSSESGARTEEGENVATLTVKLRNPDETVHIQDDIIEQMRADILRVSNDQITFTLPSLFSFKTAIELHIFGDDLERLGALGREAQALMAGVSGLRDAELSLKSGYPEVHIEMDPELLTAKNLTPSQVGTRLQTEVRGDVATQFSRGGEKIDIRVRTDQAGLQGVDNLRSLSITEGYPPTPLSAVAKIEVKEGPSEIRRIDQRQVVTVTGNVEGRDLGGVAGDIEARLANMDWPAGYVYVVGGQQRELETSYGGLVFAMAMAIFLIYVVMACQFESVWHPAIIMFSVPLAYVGVVYVLDWFDVNVSVMVFIGGIVLAGIVVNNAIVLVDYINQLRDRGYAKIDAVVESGRIRFRPIMMTTLTTVLGLIPMSMSTGEGAEIRQPLALTVMAGLTSSTLLTLFVIPMIYYFTTGRDKT